MAKKKNERQRQKRAQAAKQRRQKRRQGDAKRGMSVGIPDPGMHLPPLLLDPPRPDRLLPAVFVDASGHVVPDPRAILGLGAAPASDEAIRAAWRRGLEAHPPEQDPEGSRQIREARDRLLDPARYLERELGELGVPDADAWGLPDGPGSADPARLDALGRLVGEAVLYALVEDALWDEGLRDAVPRSRR